MRRCKLTDRAFLTHAFGGVLAALAVGLAVGADDPHRHDSADHHFGHEAHARSGRRGKRRPSSPSKSNLRSRWRGAGRAG